MHAAILFCPMITSYAINSPEIFVVLIRSETYAILKTPEGCGDGSLK